MFPTPPPHSEQLFRVCSVSSSPSRDLSVYPPVSSGLHMLCRFFLEFCKFYWLIYVCIILNSFVKTSFRDCKDLYSSFFHSLTARLVALPLAPKCQNDVPDEERYMNIVTSI